MTTPITITADRLMELAAKATRGPWQVVADYHPYRIRNDSVERHHTELRVFTEWDHPQLKGPVGVVNHSVGVGIDKPVHMVNMAAEDAGFIAACDPQTITALCSAIKEMAAERDALRQQLERMERRGDTFSEIIHNHCLAMSAALIERSIGQGAEAGMRWIANTLAGPGLLPDLDEARRLGGAQAWFDEKTDEEEQRRAELRAKVAAGGENGNG